MCELWIYFIAVFDFSISFESKYEEVIWWLERGPTFLAKMSEEIEKNCEGILAHKWCFSRINSGQSTAWRFSITYVKFWEETAYPIQQSFKTLSIYEE